MNDAGECLPRLRRTFPSPKPGAGRGQSACSPGRKIDRHIIRKKMKRICSVTALILGFCLARSHAQDTVRLELTEAIRLGKERSVQAKAVQNEYISAYWAYRTYRTELLPEVILGGTVPYYSKSFNTRQNEDGSWNYVENNYNRIDAGVSVTQNIPWTGGKITVGSSFERLHQYGDGDYTNYRSIPGTITLEQPLFGFNRVRWLQRIEPVRYKEASQKCVSDQEEVTLTTIQYYFDLLAGQTNLDISVQNLNNAERLYGITEAQYRIGRQSEIDLMQMKSTLLSAQSALTDAQISLEARMFQLRSFLGLDGNIALQAVVPQFITERIPTLHYREVVELALQNNSFTQNIQKRMLEASRNVSQAKADRWNINLFASFGMSGTADAFYRAYNSQNRRNDQVISVGVSIPILDWGKRKGKVMVADANKEVIRSRIEKEKMDFNQNVFLRVQYFNNQPRQLQLARERADIAQKRYDTSVEAFVQGKIDILNLNDARSSKDAALLNYIEQMHWLWSYYYQIRSLTLYDFIGDRPLTAEQDLR